jgi:hypothetical protein
MFFPFLAKCFDSRGGMVGTPAAYSASQEIPHNLWNPKVFHRLQKTLPIFPILSKINPFQYNHPPPPSDIFNTHFNFNFLSKPGLPTDLFSSSFPTKPYMYVPWCSRWCKCSHISFDVNKHRHLVQQLTKISDWFCLHPWFRRGTGPTSSTKTLQLCIVLRDAVNVGAKYGLWLWQGRLVPLPYVIISRADSQTRRHLVCLHRKMRVGKLCVQTIQRSVCTFCL